MTIKISPTTKAMIDAVAAKILAETKKALTSDEVIAELVRKADSDVYNQMNTLGKKNADDKGTDKK